MKRRIIAVALSLFVAGGWSLAGATPAMATAPTIAVSVPGVLVNSTGNPVPITLSDFDPNLSYAAIITVSAGTLAPSTIAGLTALTGYSALGTPSASLGFSGAYPDVSAAVTTLVYSAPSSVQDVNLTVNLTEIPSGGSDVFYNPINNHYYVAVNNGSTITWGNALAASAATTLLGMTGYLATITSPEENDFVSTKTSASSVWIGLARSNADDSGAFANQDSTDPAGLVWEWKTGPETGTDVLQQQAWNSAGGTPIAGAYNSWATGEPNNWHSGGQPAGWYEGFTVTNWQGTKGKWNDLASNSSSVRNYLIEYGGVGTSTASQAEASATISVAVPTMPDTGATVRTTIIVSTSALALFALALIAIRSRRALLFASDNDRLTRLLRDLDARLTRLEAPRRRRIRRR